MARLTATMRITVGTALYPLAGMALTLAMAGCLKAPEVPEPVTELKGQVDFGARTTQADIVEIGTYATVSIIEASSNRTVATTLTNQTGGFVFRFKGWSPTPTEYYYLEAVKGLSANQAGHSAVRLRTLGKSAGEWHTISAGSIVYLSPATTAVSLLASLKGSTTVPYESLLQSVSIGAPDSTLSPPTPDTFNAVGTGVTKAQFQQAWRNVSTAIRLNEDPFEHILLTADGGTELVLPSSGPAVYAVTPGTAPVGATISVYGDNFGTDPLMTPLKFPGGPLVFPSTCSQTMLVVTVPPGATSGDVELQTSTGTGSFPFTVIQDPAGSLTVD